MDMRCVLSASGSWAPPEGRMALNIARFDKRGKAKEAAFDLNQVGAIPLPQYRHSALWSSIHSTSSLRTGPPHCGHWAGSRPRALGLPRRTVSASRARARPLRRSLPARATRERYVGRWLQPRSGSSVSSCASRVSGGGVERITGRPKMRKPVCATMRSVGRSRSGTGL